MTPDYPVTFEVDYPEQVSRGKIFYKWLLALPHYLALSVVQPLIYLALIVWWFLWLRKPYPWPLFNLLTMSLRWNANVLAYIGLLRDEYPPFAGEPAITSPCGCGSSTSVTRSSRGRCSSSRRWSSRSRTT